MIEHRSEVVTDAGHPDVGGDIKPIGDQNGKKLKENILSGRWQATTQSEMRMLKEHKEKQKQNVFNGAIVAMCSMGQPHANVFCIFFGGSIGSHCCYLPLVCLLVSCHN